MLRVPPTPCDRGSVPGSTDLVPIAGERGGVPGYSDTVSNTARRGDGSHCDDAGCENDFHPQAFDIHFHCQSEFVRCMRASRNYMFQ